MFENQLTQLILSNSRLMTILQAVRKCDPPDWYVGAGMIRNLVWDHLHEYPQPTASQDVDVAFFDPEDLSKERDAEVEQQLRKLQPDTPWEATNQAAVHLWFEQVFGYPVQPLKSSEEAIDTWPETATCVGVRLDANDQLKIVAPCGLDDLFEMKLRRNPVRVRLEEFHKRLREKQILEKWPQVEVVDCMLDEAC